jgi:hypothetical protein
MATLDIGEAHPQHPIAIVAATPHPDSSATGHALHELFAERFRTHILPNLEIPHQEMDLPSFCALPDQYRVALFIWADCVPSRFRPIIRRWLEQPGRTAIWFHAPGLEDENRDSLAHCQEMTGIQVNADPMTNGLEIALTNFSHPFTAGLEGTGSFGTGQQEPYRFRPHFYADDGCAVTLGRLVGSDKPGLVVKPVGQGRSVYFAAPLPPSELLRRMCLANETFR